MGTPIYSDTLAERDDPNRKQRAAFARTLRNASGGPPTDNRRVQTDAIRGEVFVGLDRFALAVQAVTAQITQRRLNRSLRKMEKARRRRAYRRGRAYVQKALPTPHAHANDEQRRPVAGGGLVSLFDRPNKQQTLPAFLAMWRVQEMTTGNVLVWGNPDDAGRVREMFVLPTALCNWQPPSQQYPRGAWRVHQPNYGLVGGLYGGNYAVIPAEQVTHFKHLGHPLYHWDGLSPLTGISKWVDVLEAIDRSCWSTMQRGARRGTLIVVAGMTPDEAREQTERVNAEKGGADNAGSTWIIGSTNPGSAPPEVHDPDSAREMDFQTSREKYAALVMAAMGVPPELMGMKSAGSYAAYYAAMKQFRDTTLVPWLASVAAALTIGVVATWDDGDDDLKLQLDLPAFNNEEQAEAVKTRQITNGLVTHNQALRADNLPPVADEKADVLPTVLYLKYLEQKHLPPPAPPPGQQPGSGADPSAALSGDGPDSGDAPRPDNPAGKGSLPPRTKAFDVGDWLTARGYAP